MLARFRRIFLNTTPRRCKWRPKQDHRRQRSATVQARPGESLDFMSLGVPGPDYLPLRKSFLREIARGLSVTFGALTLDNEKRHLFLGCGWTMQSSAECHTPPRPHRRAAIAGGL